MDPEKKISSRFLIIYVRITADNSTWTHLTDTGERPISCQLDSLQRPEGERISADIRIYSGLISSPARAGQHITRQLRLSEKTAQWKNSSALSSYVWDICHLTLLMTLYWLKKNSKLKVGEQVQGTGNWSEMAFPPAGPLGCVGILGRVRWPRLWFGMAPGIAIFLHGGQRGFPTKKSFDL